jgi:tetratricopeptide (TPR) repeat protein
VYFFVEVLPGWNWKLPAIERFERRRRRQWLEKMASESPSTETMTELAKLCALERDDQRAVELFSAALERDPDDTESLYGRGAAQQRLGRHQEALDDLAKVYEQDPAHSFHQAALRLAEAHEQLGRDDAAEAVYRSILSRTTVSGAYYGLGALLAKQGNSDEARALMQEILSKQTGLPRYLRRQERPWVRKAKALLKTM